MNAIASYDIFRRLDLDIFDNFKTVVIDECQAIKNPDIVAHGRNALEKLCVAQKS